jgi:hypothetical protein
LAARRNEVQPELDAFLVASDLHPFGWGYIDIIAPLERCEEFVSKVTALEIPIPMIALWCHCTDQNRQRYGCPHGFGGPACEGGFFSEMCEPDSFEPSIPESRSDRSEDLATLLRDCNAQAIECVRAGMKRMEDYSPCLVPGFWLAVPEDWRNSWAREGAA